MKHLDVNVRWIERVRNDEFKDHLVYREKLIELEPQMTAVVVSDMWAKHWCAGATKRVGELAPQMNQLISYLRGRGFKIIYCPSGTEQVYANKPQKKKLDKYNSYYSFVPSEVASFNDNLIPDIQTRIDPNAVQCDCSFLEKCDCSLKPWKSLGQIGTLTIAGNDLIGMDNYHVCSYLQQEKYTHVLVMGVHANMCVIYREFGLKQLKMLGITPIIIRDMTDCMVPREEAPYQDHFTALDCTIRFIEEYLAPSITSHDIMKSLTPFRFSEDKRRCQSSSWGDAKEGETFDDYDSYLNYRLLEPAKIRIWIPPHIDKRPGIYGIQVDYYQKRFVHGNTAGKEHSIPIPFGDYITKIEARHGNIALISGKKEDIIYYLRIYGKNKKDGSPNVLGEIWAGNENRFKNRQTVVLNAEDGYRVNCIGGTFSSISQALNKLFFDTQAVQFFEVTQDETTFSTDILSSKYEDKVWNTFYINGCFRAATTGCNLVFPYWLCLDETGKSQKVKMRDFSIIREKTGKKKIKERKSVTFKDQNGNTAQARPTYYY